MKIPIRTVGTGLPDGPPSDAGGASPSPTENGGGYDLASLREGGGTALAGIFFPFVCAPSWSRDGGSLRVMELYLEFYRVFNKTQPLYSPFFLQDLVLTISSLDYPMAPSVTFGDSSLPEGAEENGGSSAHKFVSP